jgi:GTP-binding protein HflX
VRGDRDAVVLSATERETTRDLITLVAGKLAERWDDAASVPEVRVDEGDPESGPKGEGDEDDKNDDNDKERQSTLEEMLRATGRRPRRRVVSS